jgi:MoxR-like ATPase
MSESKDFPAYMQRVIGEFAKVVEGQRDVVESVFMTSLLGGHALIEGPPGTAKTLIVRTLGLLMNCRFRRIQFTPDLMPSDVIGTNVYDQRTGDFRFREGPIFTDLLLADEINRAPSKTQAALLECMEERHATVDGVRHHISPVFTVFATQNPIEFEGTYPLPEAQLDRFMSKILVGFPDHDEEMKILALHDSGFDPSRLEQAGIEPVMRIEDVLGFRERIAATRVEEKVRGYITDIVQATRRHPQVSVGASPRAAVFMLRMAKAIALLEGRDYAVPDDVKRFAPPILRHRIILKPEAEIEGLSTDDVVADLLASIKVPM